MKLEPIAALVPFAISTRSRSVYGSSNRYVLRTRMPPRSSVKINVFGSGCSTPYAARERSPRPRSTSAVASATSPGPVVVISTGGRPACDGSSYVSSDQCTSAPPQLVNSASTSSFWMRTRCSGGGAAGAGTDADGAGASALASGGGGVAPGCEGEGAGAPCSGTAGAGAGGACRPV